MLTAEALLATFSPPLPYVFPGLLRDAEELCAAAGSDPEHAAVLYAHAEQTWSKLLGPKRRHAS
jgi:hypothetical protein